LLPELAQEVRTAPVLVQGKTGVIWLRMEQRNDKQEPDLLWGLLAVRKNSAVL